MNGTVIALAIVFVAVVAMWPRHGLLARWRASRDRRDRMQAEDALKHILNAEDRGGASDMASLAGALGASTDRAAEVAGDLAERGLIEIRGTGFRLTQEGREYAVHVLRAHRLWERYLADETGYHESEWHSRAETMEHVLSPSDTEDLAARLGHPTHDPHGDPIPTSEGEIRPHGGAPLTEADVDTPLRIVHIEDEPGAVYAQLIAERLTAGMMARATEISPTRVVLWTENGQHLLAPIVAANVFAVPAPESETVEEDVLRLADLAIGQRAEVQAVSRACRATERRRLLDLGILPGTIIEVEFRSPAGDPTAYLVRGATIALRRRQAEMIRVEMVEEAA